MMSPTSILGLWNGRFLDAPGRDRRRRFRPSPELLEGRALLSRGAFGRGVHPFFVADHRPGPVAVDSTDRSGLAVRNAEFVTDLYRRLLHREPDRQGLHFWVGQLDDREVGRLEVATAFLLSREYATSHRDHASFVDGLYRDVLGRAPDRPGRAFWTPLLSRRRADRALVAGRFLASAEAFLRERPTFGSS